jgi:hypothetical protein
MSIGKRVPAVAGGLGAVVLLEVTAARYYWYGAYGRMNRRPLAYEPPVPPCR